MTTRPRRKTTRKAPDQSTPGATAHVTIRVKRNIETEEKARKEALDITIKIVGILPPDPPSRVTALVAQIRSLIGAGKAVGRIYALIGELIESVRKHL